MKRKVFSWAILLLFVATLLATVLPTPAKVQAVDNQNILGSLCVPWLENGQVRGWLSVSVINRAIMKISWNTDGDCYSPSGRSTEFFSPNKKFVDLFGSGKAIDQNTDDTTIEYVMPVGNDYSDDTHINGFNGSFPKDGTDGRDQSFSVDQIVSRFTGSKILMSWEEETAVSPEVCEANNDNIALIGDQQNNLKWLCRRAGLPNQPRPIGQTIPISKYSNLDNFNIAYNVVGTGTATKIVHVSPGQRDTRTFVWSTADNKFISYADGGAFGPLKISSINGKSNYTLADFASIAGGQARVRIIRDNNESKYVDTIVAGPSSLSATFGQTTAKDISTTVSGSGGTSTTAADQGSCELRPNPLTWILCPIITIAKEGVRQFDAAITRELTIDNRYLDEGSDGGGRLYEVWSNFRGIAWTLLVVIALIMVISQALSIGPFDAYTIRKVLPRILIAIIGITFSWELCKFLIDFSNVLGIGTKGIILSPFSVSGKELNLGINGVFSGILVTGALGAAGVTLGILGLLSFAVTAFLAVLIAFALVVVRKIGIIFLVVLAPLAMIAYILPNTQKYWKLWWESFTKLLLVFPLIMGVIAIGRAVALMSQNLISQTNNSNDLVLQAVVFIGYFGPYFIIPKLFAMAGGVLGTLSGMINDRSRGGFDRLKGYRARKTGENWAATKSFSRFNPNSRLGKAFGAKYVNSALGGAAAGPKAWTRKGGITAARETQMTLAGAAAVENDKVIAANKNNDKFLAAVASSEFAAAQRQDAVNKGNMAEVAAWDQAIGLAGQINRNNPAVRLQATQMLAATGYQLSKGQEGYNQLAEMVASATGAELIRDAAGNVTGATGPRAGAYANAMNGAQYNLKNAMRFDLAGINDGAGFNLKAGLDKADPYTMSRAKKQTAEGLYTLATDRLSQPTITNEDYITAQTSLLELESIAQNATGAVRDQAIKSLEEFRTSTDPAIDAMRTNLGAWSRTDLPPTVPPGSPPGTRPVQPTTRERENYVRGTSIGWQQADIARGWRVITRNKTNGDVARERARVARMPREDE